MRAPPVLLTLLPLLLSACVVVRSDLGVPVPSDEQLGVIEPGRTSAWEAMTLLGPPEEFRSPTMNDLARAQDELARRVYEDRSLFDRRQLTWVFERRESDLFLLFPGITFYGRIERDHMVDRVVMLLDEQGVVEHVAVRREVGTAVGDVPPRCGGLP